MSHYQMLLSARLWPHQDHIAGGPNLVVLRYGHNDEDEVRDSVGRRCHAHARHEVAPEDPPLGVSTEPGGENELPFAEELSLVARQARIDRPVDKDDRRRDRRHSGW